MVAIVPRAPLALVPVPAPAVATTRLSSRSRRGPRRSQAWRPRRFGFWTICQEWRRRSCQDMRSIGASLLRRLPKDIETICQDRTRRPAKDIQSIVADASRRSPKNIEMNYGDNPQPSTNDVLSIGADIARQLSKNIEMNADSPQRSLEATSRLFSNPWRPNTQARPRNTPPNATTVTRTRALSHLLCGSQSQWWRDTIIWPFGLRNSAMTSR